MKGSTLPLRHDMATANLTLLWQSENGHCTYQECCNKSMGFIFCYMHTTKWRALLTIKVWYGHSKSNITMAKWQWTKHYNTGLKHWDFFCSDIRQSKLNCEL